MAPLCTFSPERCQSGRRRRSCSFCRLRAMSSIGSADALWPVADAAASISTASVAAAGSTVAFAISTVAWIGVTLLGSTFAASRFSYSVAATQTLSEFFRISWTRSGSPKAYRVTLSRLVPDFSVRTWEIQQEKSHKIEKVTVLTTPCSSAAASNLGSTSASIHPTSALPMPSSNAHCARATRMPVAWNRRVTPSARLPKRERCSE
eukprot:SAG31_NODE_1294_length_8954_cov_2.434557_4_plen_206_part_00